MLALIHQLPVTDGGRLAFLAAVYALAAVFSGLSGFGFSALGALSLLVLPPQVGVVQLMMLSLLTQASSFKSLWPELRHHVLTVSWRAGPAPYMVGGMLGMPLGLLILARADARALTCALGVFLMAYAAWSIARPARAVLKARAPALWQALLVGAAGGAVGGFSAFPGAVLVVWNGLQGLSKDQGRAVTQPFILFMQLVGLALLAIGRPDCFDARFWAMDLLSAPVALAGNRLGVLIYRRTGDLGYRRITLIALGISGMALLIKSSGFLLSAGRPW